MRLAKWRSSESLGHLSEGVAVKMDDSTIKGAGKGVFAAKNFTVDEAITFYDGYRISRRKRLTEEDDLYTIEDHDENIAIVGFHKFKKGQTNWKGYGVAQFCNDPLYPCITGKYANVYYSSLSDRRIGIKALRPISKGEELFVDYGGNFWEKRLKTHLNLDTRAQTCFEQHIVVKKILLEMDLECLKVTECHHDLYERLDFVLKATNDGCDACNGKVFYLNLVAPTHINSGFLRIMCSCGAIIRFLQFKHKI